MQVQTVPLSDFVHGNINAVAGRARLMEEGLARDLEAQGLLRIRSVVSGPHARALPPGKSPAAGQVPPSSASPVAPASPPKTATASTHGGKPKAKHRGA